MKLTKERVAILVLSLLLLLTLAAGLIAFLRISREYKSEKESWEAERKIFEKATTGEFIERDGVLQNPLIYLTDITVDRENEWLTFTLRDRDNGFLSTSPGMVGSFIEKKTNGIWEGLFFEEVGVPDVGYRTGKRFDEIPSSCPFPAQYQTPGEYRVLYKVDRSSEHQQYVYAVGYFSIP